jgi:hypothetical protein
MISFDLVTKQYPGGFNRPRYLEITQGSFTAHQALEWGKAGR